MSHRSTHLELDFTDAEFHRLRHVVRRYTGIHLSTAKRELVYGRLWRRVRSLSLASFGEYCNLLESEPREELQELTNAITTNLTSFFREPHHFEALQREVFGPLAALPPQRMRLWSAGCSTGQEAYSLAIALHEAFGTLAGRDIRLLATDIDSQVLATAQQGRYAQAHCEGLSGERLTRWFNKSAQEPLVYQAHQALQRIISFRQLNLFESWPMSGPFQVIFCRNVAIYFDKPAQRDLFDRMADLQEPGAWLFIGHSESLFGVTNRYQAVGRTIYRRVD